LEGNTKRKRGGHGGGREVGEDTGGGEAYNNDNNIEREAQRKGGREA